MKMHIAPRGFAWFAAFCFASFLAAGEKIYLIEAETMAETGRYALEKESKKASGGYFLHAAEAGEKCRGLYRIPRSGKYVFYLRNLGYGENSRKVALFVDGREIGIAGDERNGFLWSRAGEAELTAGEHEIALCARGVHTRPDALLLVPGDKLPCADDALPAEKDVERLPALDGEILRGKIALNGTTEKAPFSSHRCGEKIDFVFHPACDGKALTTGFLLYHFRGDDGEESSGKVALTGEKIVLPATLKKPGFVWCHAALGKESGGRALCADPGTGGLYQATFVSAAGADEEKIPQIAEPADFDIFWGTLKKELAAVPFDATLREVAGRQSEKFATFAVEAACAGARPVTGYLVMPRGATAHSLPAEVGFQGYGLHKPFFPNPRPGKIYFEINAHGMPLGENNDFYRDFFKPLQGYAMHDGADPQRCYFHDMAYRVLRALEFVRTLSEWDGKNLIVSGGSQGGMQSLWAAAQDDKVTFCRISVPWNCNLGGGYFGLIQPSACAVEFFPGLLYYDSANHAKRITCPVEITRAGLCDTICPPAGVARMYHNLKCPKKITWYENNTHFAPLPGTKTFTFGTDDFPSE